VAAHLQQRELVLHLPTKRTDCRKRNIIELTSARPGL
jgi:hypothetical protein